MFLAENLQIGAPNNYNSEEDGAQSLIFQIHSNLTDQAFPPSLQPNYSVDDSTFFPQTPVYFPLPTSEHGDNLLPSPSYAADTGGCSIFPYLDHGADILNGAD